MDSDVRVLIVKVTNILKKMLSYRYIVTRLVSCIDPSNKSQLSTERELSKYLSLAQLLNLLKFQAKTPQPALILEVKREKAGNSLAIATISQFSCYMRLSSLFIYCF